LVGSKYKRIENELGKKRGAKLNERDRGEGERERKRETVDDLYSLDVKPPTEDTPIKDVEK